MNVADLPDHHVLVKFGKGISADAQGKAMLGFEKFLRELTGLRVEVFKEMKGDDSMLRNRMTTEQRAKL